MKRGSVNAVVLLILLVFLLFVQDVFSQAEYNDYSLLKMRVEIDNSFSVKNNIAKIDFISANLSYFPRTEGNQKVVDLSYWAMPAVKNIGYSEENIPFYWEKPTALQYEFSMKADIEVINSIMPVNSKIDFPIENIESQYIMFGNKIDINDNIRSKAQELADGEDDLYVVAFKIASWVQENIKYDLNSLTAEAVQSSSWVFDNKDGVCDELTNLYISMMRSLGVPARFVSGMAYTNAGNKWGPHAWAEVYFPEKGWLPFDITYKQFGWIDPSHIKMKQGFDSGESSVRYLWRGNNLDLNVGKMNVKTSLISAGEKIKKGPVDISIRSLGGKVIGPGSYVPIEITLENNNGFYVPESITITKAQELEGSNFKIVLLKPNEKKVVYWIMKIPSNLEPLYTYSTVVEANDIFLQTKSINVSYSFNGDVYSKEQAENFLNESNKETKTYSSEMQLICTHSDYSYSYENFIVKCIIKNTGNKKINNIKICYEADCKLTNLGIAEESFFNFTLKNLKTGRKNIEIKASTDNLIANYRASFNVYDNPALQIAQFDYNPNMDFYSTSNIGLILLVKAPVNNARLYFDNREIARIDELVSSKKAVIKAKGMDFLKKDSFNFKITFADRNGREYIVSKDYPLNVQNIPWYIKFVRWIGLQ